ncbi:MAG: SHOCT domain-containing protein [Desulfosudaceae bacterium]
MFRFFKRKKDKTPPSPPPETDSRAGSRREPGLVGSVFLAYGIVLLHLALIALAVLLVLILNGVVNYFIWLVLGGLATVCGGAWLFMKKIMSQQEAVRELLRLPEFQGKTLEISLFGGAASLKVDGGADSAVDVKAISSSSTPLLEAGLNSRLDGLGELSRLYQNGMITEEEFRQLKQELLTPNQTAASS